MPRSFLVLEMNMLERLPPRGLMDLLKEKGELMVMSLALIVLFLDPVPDIIGSQLVALS